MNEPLPRLKPDPIPTFRTVPEALATGQLKAVYDTTKTDLGVPWMGVVTMAFAQYPQFYAQLWSAIAPIARSKVFKQACQQLRTATEAEVQQIPPTDLLPLLRQQSYHPADIAEIRACLEVFSAGNMPYVLIATLARLLLEGHPWDTQGSPGPLVEPTPVGPRPVLMEPHHADPTIRDVYADIRQTLGLPFINTDYRALARWPSYFALAWQNLRTLVEHPGYEAAVTRVHDKAVALALALPNTVGLRPEVLQQTAKQDAPGEEVLSVVALFQWLLPGLATNVALLRGQLLED